MQAYKMSVEKILTEGNMEPYDEYDELIDQYYRLCWDLRDLLADDDAGKHLLTQKSYDLAILEGSLESVERRILQLIDEGRRRPTVVAEFVRGVGVACEEILAQY